VTYVDERLLAPVIARFGFPAEWDASREVGERERDNIARSARSQRQHDVTFAVERDGLLAVIRKPLFPPGAWRIPSGGIAPGETFEEGARREALEETGLEIELTGYPLVARSVFTYEGEQLPWVTHVVTAAAADGELAPRDREEIDDARWISWEELTGPVAEVLRGSGGALFAYRAELHNRVAALVGVNRPS
jgi:ADP-ribose pyrophosphatase YjhB (NUDIX family)